MLTFCSVVTPGTLAAARVLAAGLREHHLDARVVVLLCDGAVTKGAGEPFETLAPSDLGEGLDETAGSLAPALVRRILGEGAELAVYLAPEVCVYGPLDSPLALARGNGVVVLPRVAKLPEDGKRPDHGDLLAAGRISDAFVAVASGQPGERF